MSRLVLTLAAAFVLMRSPVAQAQNDVYSLCSVTEKYVANSISYNDMLGRTQVEKANYITAWLSGFVSGTGERSISCADRITKCLTATSPPQRVAMLEAVAKKEPEKWGQPSNVSWYIWLSFVKPCWEGKIPLE